MLSSQRVNYIRHHFVSLLSAFSLLILSGVAYAESTKISVIELNTWGVPLAVKDTFRYREAMTAINELNPDIVFLEEVFSGKGKRAFHSAQYPYEANGPKANLLKFKLVPSGVRILSKFPIISSARAAFRDCLKDDCLSNKGAVLAVVELPNGQHLNVLNAHLNARGDDRVRMAQLDQMKLLFQEFGDLDAPLLLGGDFNFNPESPAYSYILSILGLKDTWTETHSANELGWTYDAIKNQYAHDYCIQTHFPITQERIDFLMIRSTQKAIIKPISSKVIFDEGMLYSDHYGLTAEYEMTTEE